MWNLQNILVYLALLAALIYLAKKYFFKKKKRSSSGCESDCNCH
jgi:hypothetical protein